MQSPRSILRRLKNVLSPQGSLSAKTVSSGIWASLINVVDKVLQLGKLVVVANLIAPADFGLMGIALLTLGALQQFSRLGLDEALIQHKEENVDSYLDTAWTLKSGRGLLLGLIAFGAAPLAAAFFNEPRATDIIRVIALSPLITGIQNPGVMYFRKELEFHREFVYKLSGTLVAVTVTIVAALMLRNVWALVFGLLAGSTVRSITSYLVHDYRPRPAFDVKKGAELYSFGRWLTVSGIVLFLITQGDDAFVGWALGAAALGFYQLAYRFSNAPATEVTHVISSVMLPTYSKVQTERQVLRETFLKTLFLISLISFPVTAGIVAVTPTFVRTFLGPQWEAAIIPMQILAIFGLLRSIVASFGPLYKAIGRPDYDTKIQFIHLTVLAILIYPLSTRWGVVGTSGAVTLSLAVASVVNYYLLVQVLETSYRRIVTTLAPALVGAASMGGLVFGIRSEWLSEPGVVPFAVLVLLGVGVYIPLMYFFETQFDIGIRDLATTFRTALE